MCVKGLSRGEMIQGVALWGKNVDCKRKIDKHSLISDLFLDFGEGCPSSPSVTRLEIHRDVFSAPRWCRLCAKLHLLCLD